MKTGVVARDGKLRHFRGDASGLFLVNLIRLSYSAILGSPAGSGKQGNTVKNRLQVLMMRSYVYYHWPLLNKNTGLYCNNVLPLTYTDYNTEEHFYSCPQGGSVSSAFPFVPDIRDLILTLKEGLKIFVIKPDC